MKKLILMLSVLGLIFGSLMVGYCMEIDRDEINYANSPINKLERGVINMATFWMEMPAEVAKVSHEQNPVSGLTVGVVNGTITSAIRGLTAIYDTATFVLPSYSKPIMKPEYAWKAADDKIKAWLW